MNASDEISNEASIHIPSEFISKNLDFFKEPLIAIFCLNVCLSILATVANGIIIIAILRSQNLQTPSYFLITSFSFLDFLVGLIHLPFLSVRTVFRLTNRYNEYIDDTELTALSIGLYLTGMSFVMSLLISIDRYLALSLKLRYRVVVTKKKVFSSILFFCIIGVPLTWMALHLDGFLQNWQVISTIFGFSFLTLTCSFYLLAFRALHRYTAQVHVRSNETHANFDIVVYKKSLHTMLIILGCLLVCYTPYLSSVFALSKARPNNLKQVIIYNQFSMVLFGLNSIINPLIYLLRFKDIRLACRQTLKLLIICR